MGSAGRSSAKEIAVKLLDLFRPRWKRSDCRTRKAAVEGLADRAVLAEVASTAPVRDVWLAAIEKLQLVDQVALAELAGVHTDPARRLAAAFRLAEPTLQQATYVALATSKERFGERETATKYITDQTVLAVIAAGHEDQRMREVAIERLTDQRTLAVIATKSAESEWVRLKAIERLTDQVALEELARTQTDPRVRLAVATRIADSALAQAVFAKLATGDADYSLRQAAAGRLADRSLAEDVIAECRRLARIEELRARIYELESTLQSSQHDTWAEDSLIADSAEQLRKELKDLEAR